MSDQAPAELGPPVKWVTIERQFDADDRLISERTTTTTAIDTDIAQSPLSTGMYL